MSEAATTASPDALAQLDWSKGQGFIPAIIQDARTLRVLMLGYMNQQSLAHTQRTGHVTFYSRRHQRLWTKGEQSGHTLLCQTIDVDCDRDTLLIQAIPAGPTCHLGRTSCFAHAPGQFLGELAALIAQRVQDRPRNSYTTTLLAQGIVRIAQKVGEEGVETALAAVSQSPQDLIAESADLLFHLMVLLQAKHLSLADPVAELARRHLCSSTQERPSPP